MVGRRNRTLPHIHKTGDARVPFSPLLRGKVRSNLRIDSRASTLTRFNNLEVDLSSIFKFIIVEPGETEVVWHRVLRLLRGEALDPLHLLAVRASVVQTRLALEELDSVDGVLVVEGLGALYERGRCGLRVPVELCHAYIGTSLHQHACSKC